MSVGIYDLVSEIEWREYFTIVHFRVGEAEKDEKRTLFVSWKTETACSQAPLQNIHEDFDAKKNQVWLYSSAETKKYPSTFQPWLTHI